jgi:cytoskeletal protein CcmA (bactofilin family)
MAFGAKKEEVSNKAVTSSTQSVLAKDLSIKGDISCSGLLRVEGHVEGSIKGNGEITISEGATLKAEVDGRKIIVLGKIEGNVKASESIELVSSAQVFGDITTDKISIEEGAVFTGKCITKQLPEKKEEFTAPETKKEENKFVQK